MNKRKPKKNRSLFYNGQCLRKNNSRKKEQGK